MKAMRLSEHIGNMDERLIEQAQHVPNYGNLHRKRRIRHLAAAAAAAVLMVGSFSAGAIAFAREVVVEVPVEVEPERLSIEEIGLELLLPDEWSGRYGLEKDGENYVVYNRQIREALSDGTGEPFGGVLFYIVCYDMAMTPEQFVENGFDYTGYRYLFSTKERTYILYDASDVQWDPNDGEQERVYQQMESQVKEIRFVVDGVLAEE